MDHETCNQNQSDGVNDLSPVVMPSTYEVKPSVKKVREIIEEEQRNAFTRDLKYSADIVSNVSKEISTRVKNRLKDIGLPQHKYFVQVVMGEKRDQGVHMGCRCLWEEENDNYTSVTFSNDHIFCVITAFLVYQH